MTFNPITRLDFPDPDVIRVGDTWYMVSTTMHFMPGAEILQSKDLVHWEHLTFVYDRLDSTPGQRLEGENHIYGKGMWAASLRYHKGTFYVCFVANDTHKTYLYTASNIAGPWEKHELEGIFCHDCSLLFDDDGRVYIAYGAIDIHITELKADLSGPKPGGLDRIAVRERGNPYLHYEGTHFYKVNGKYYLFFIHSRYDRWRKVEACYVADAVDSEFVGGDIFDDDMGFGDQGIAQGGIVDDPEGRWYAILFQDTGASGRIPVLLPMHWEDGQPVFGVDGKVPMEFPRPVEVPAAPLVESDDFTTTGGIRTHGAFGLKSCWQFNHEPDLSLTHLDTAAGTWTVTTDKICRDLTFAKNTITQRTRFPGCAGEVTVDASGMKVGDVAGLCALQGCYAFAAIVREADGYRLTMRERKVDRADLQPLPRELMFDQTCETIPWDSPRAEFRAVFDFEQMKDEVTFFCRKVPQDRTCPEDELWRQIGSSHYMFFKMDHFVGVRFALFVYATQETGGKASFSNFIYE